MLEKLKSFFKIVFKAFFRTPKVNALTTLLLSGPYLRFLDLSFKVY